MEVSDEEIFEAVKLMNSLKAPSTDDAKLFLWKKLEFVAKSVCKIVRLLFSYGHMLE